MAKTKQVFTETFKIRSSEVRPDGKVKLQTICDLLQEIAGNHALQLNFDVTQLHEKNMTWFLHRLDVQVDQYPEWREQVTVKTWPSRGDRLKAYRDFEILDENGKRVVRALSYWLMVDLASRRPIRMPEEVLEMGPMGIEHVIPLKNSRPSPPETADIEKTFSVRKSDLDVNRHVNNIRYVEWISETIPHDKLVRSIDIEFKAECGYGDDILVRTSNASNGIFHSNVVLSGSEKVLATAEIKI